MMEFGALFLPESVATESLNFKGLNFVDLVQLPRLVTVSEDVGLEFPLENVAGGALLNLEGEFVKNSGSTSFKSSSSQVSSASRFFKTMRVITVSQTNCSVGSKTFQHISYVHGFSRSQCLIY